MSAFLSASSPSSSSSSSSLFSISCSCHAGVASHRVSSDFFFFLLLWCHAAPHAAARCRFLLFRRDFLRDASERLRLPSRRSAWRRRRFVFFASPDSALLFTPSADRLIIFRLFGFSSSFTPFHFMRFRRERAAAIAFDFPPCPPLPLLIRPFRAAFLRFPLLPLSPMATPAAASFPPLAPALLRHAIRHISIFLFAAAAAIRYYFHAIIAARLLICRAIFATLILLRRCSSFAFPAVSLHMRFDRAAAYELFYLSSSRHFAFFTQFHFAFHDCFFFFFRCLHADVVSDDDAADTMLCWFHGRSSEVAPFEVALLFAAADFILMKPSCHAAAFLRSSFWAAFAAAISPLVAAARILLHRYALFSLMPLHSRHPPSRLRAIAFSASLLHAAWYRLHFSADRAQPRLPRRQVAGALLFHSSPSPPFALLPSPYFCLSSSLI